MTAPRNNNSRQKYLRQEYISRINRVIDFIEANIDQDLSLASLAKVANFSQFHFHRIFRAMVGETLNGFIQRIRLEKAAARLLDHPKDTITEIAGDEFEDAWNMLMGGWLPESGYQPDDRLCYELCLNNPREHPENKHIVDICVPVKPL